MLSHPYGVVTLWEIEHQELMREAARDRLAASAQRGKPAPLARLRTAQRTATSWLRERRPLPMGGELPARVASHGV